MNMQMREKVEARQKERRIAQAWVQFAAAAVSTMNPLEWTAEKIANEAVDVANALADKYEMLYEDDA